MSEAKRSDRDRRGLLPVDRWCSVAGGVYVKDPYRTGEKVLSVRVTVSSSCFRARQVPQIYGTLSIPLGDRQSDPLLASGAPTTAGYDRPLGGQDLSF